MTKFSLKSRIHSFYHAWAGLRFLIIKEHNARIHFITAFGVIVLGFLLKIEKWEWIAVLICIGLVVCIEILNTAVEQIADFIQPEFDLRIKIIKDLGAAAVVFMAFITSIVGLLVFLPKIVELL